MDTHTHTYWVHLLSSCLSMSKIRSSFLIILLNPFLSKHHPLLSPYFIVYNITMDIIIHTATTTNPQTIGRTISSVLSLSSSTGIIAIRIGMEREKEQK